MEGFTGRSSRTPPNSGGSRWSPLRSILQLICLLWIIEYLNIYVFDGGLRELGIYPRVVHRLPYIVTAPFIHIGWGHLANNSVALLIFGLCAHFESRKIFWEVSTAILVGSGLFVWLIGASGTITVGASGIAYGYFGYVLTRGIVTRRASSLGIATAILVLYWSALGGILPDSAHPEISWQGHLGGFLTGILVAWRMGIRRF